MSTASKLRLLFGLAALTVPAFADEKGNWLAVAFPRDSPVVSVEYNMGPSTATARGSSMVIDLHAGLVLRNVGTKPISGLTLRVEAQDLSPHGKGSVIKPSLFVMPGEQFPVKVDMQLTRPITAARSETAMVQVTIDCALFNDLSAYGPDKLNSKRTLMVYEMQARRDRRFLARLLDSGRLPELREELNFGNQDFSPPQLGLELLRGPHMTTMREQLFSVNPVNFPKGPVQPLGGAAQVAGNEVRAPRVDIRNVSQQHVASVAMGWIVRDERGRDYVAGALTSRLPLGPVQTSFISEAGTLRFSSPGGQPMVIGRLMTFVNDVEFADGTVWIPSRDDIDAATQDYTLRRELATSPEEQRLASIYRREGTTGLKRELKRVSLVSDKTN
jgi:hypothetical protein